MMMYVEQNGGKKCLPNLSTPLKSLHAFLFSCNTKEGNFHKVNDTMILIWNWI